MYQKIRFVIFSEAKLSWSKIGFLKHSIQTYPIWSSDHTNSTLVTIYYMYTQLLTYVSSHPDNSRVWNWSFLSVLLYSQPLNFITSCLLYINLDTCNIYLYKTEVFLSVLLLKLDTISLSTSQVPYFRSRYESITITCMKLKFVVSFTHLDIFLTLELSINDPFRRLMVLNRAWHKACKYMWDAHSAITCSL